MTKDALDIYQLECKAEEFRIEADPAWVIARIRGIDPGTMMKLLHGKDGGRKLFFILSEVFPEATLLMNDEVAVTKIGEGFYNHLGKMDTVPRDLKPASRFEVQVHGETSSLPAGTAFQVTQLSEAPQLGKVTGPGLREKTLQATDRIADITSTVAMPVVGDTVIITLDEALRGTAMKTLTETRNRLMDLGKDDDDPLVLPDIQLNAGFTYPLKVTWVDGPEKTTSKTAEVSGYLGVTHAPDAPAIRIHLTSIPTQTGNRTTGCWRHPQTLNTDGVTKVGFPESYYEIDEGKVVITTDLPGGHKATDTAKTPPPAKK